MSSKYREDRNPIPTQYIMSGNRVMPNCPGSCTCNLGTRSSYDDIQKSGKLYDLPMVKSVPGWKV